MKKEGRSLWAPSANRTRWWFEEKPARAAPPVRTKTTQGRTGYLSSRHMSKHMLIGGINALPYSSHVPAVHI